jgi:hypothetical protein
MFLSVGNHIAKFYLCGFYQATGVATYDACLVVGTLLRSSSFFFCHHQGLNVVFHYLLGLHCVV